jgi:hypothetical protein
MIILIGGLLAMSDDIDGRMLGSHNPKNQA